MELAGLRGEADGPHITKRTTAHGSFVNTMGADEKMLFGPANGPNILLKYSCKQRWQGLAA